MRLKAVALAGLVVLLAAAATVFVAAMRDDDGLFMVAVGGAMVGAAFVTTAVLLSIRNLTRQVEGIVPATAESLRSSAFRKTVRNELDDVMRRVDARILALFEVLERGPVEAGSGLDSEHRNGA